jgi:anti-sigma regulatory factor (Ser/Thr protein kinase)
VVAPEIGRLVLASTASSARRARDFTHKQLADWGLQHLIDDAVTVVSELLTNAITHALPPAKSEPARSTRESTPLQLVLLRHRRHLEVVVADPGGTPPVPVRAEDATLLDTCGRGLHIVGALSCQWGWASLSSGGKAVWAVLDDPDHP